MRKVYAIASILWILTTIPSNSISYADNINLVADEWCPYNCLPNKDQPGFIIEIAKYAFEREGHEVHYTLIPWARAVRETRKGKYTGIVGAGRKEVPDFIFPENELGFAAHTFFVNRGVTWKYTGIKSLDQISIGVIRDYSYGNLYKTYIKPQTGNNDRVQIVSGETGLSQNINKLLLNRIGALIEDRTVFEYHLKRTKTPNDFLEAGIVFTEKVYIAFSPVFENAEEYAEILSKAMTELRSSGKLHEILQKYGVKDWKSD